MLKIHIARHLKSSLYGRDFSKKKGSKGRTKEISLPVMKKAKAEGHRTSLIKDNLCISGKQYQGNVSVTQESVHKDEWITLSPHMYRYHCPIFPI